jgi:hypothetical protein
MSGKRGVQRKPDRRRKVPEIGVPEQEEQIASEIDGIVFVNPSSPPNLKLHATESDSSDKQEHRSVCSNSLSLESELPSKFHADHLNDVSFGCGLLGAPRFRQEIGPHPSHVEGEAVRSLTSAAIGGKIERNISDQNKFSDLSHVENTKVMPIDNNVEGASKFFPGSEQPDELLEEEIRIKIEELKIRQLCLDLAKRRAMSKRDYPNEPRFDHVISPASNSSNLLNDLYRSAPCQKTSAVNVALPKIEIQPFDGTVKSFWSFMKTFEATLANKVSDDSERLSCLLYYCRGPAKEAIENCILLEPSVGYGEALKILKEQFGRPHVIVHALMSEILEGPAIRPTNLEGLRSLARKMRGCLTTLTQMDRLAELNCSTNLLRVIERLPREAKFRWAEVADSIIRDEREPSFEDLLTFIERRVSVASSLYGAAAAASNESFDRPPARKTETRSRVLSAFLSSPIVCICCQQQHSLDDCQKFRNTEFSDKQNLLRRHKRCFLCFKPNHLAKNCQLRIRCTVEGCHGNHNTLMHRDTSLNLKTRLATAHIGAVLGESKAARLGFIPVRLVSSTREVLTYALIDNGSDVTLVDDEVSSRLNLNGKSCKLNVRTLHGTRIISGKQVGLEIQSLSSDFSVPVDLAYVVKSLPVTRVDASSVRVEDWAHLKGITCETLPDNKVGILIGCNVPEAHWVLEQRLGNRKDPYAIKSAFGWCIRGPPNTSHSREHCVNWIGAEESCLEHIIQKMFEHEFNEKGYAEKTAMSVEDNQALEIAESSLAYSAGRYEVSLPWKTGCLSLPDNYAMAERRVQMLKKRLDKDTQLRIKYFDLIENYNKKGYIRKVSTGEAGRSRRWYLPHHPVLNPNKPGKVRIVFDCAATFKDSSLNRALLQGPDLTSSLVGVLLRFRKYPVAVCADIEEMFLQVRVPPKDRWALSFLWWDNTGFVDRPGVFEINVHPFGATSSPFCANFALRRTAVDNRDKFSMAAVKAVEESFYVDDCLLSVETVKQGKQVVDELRTMLRMGGFNLTKWISNRSDVVQHLPSEDKVREFVDLDFESRDCQRTLGVRWDVRRDEFQFQLKLPNAPATRRGILKCVASLYDPLGLVAPMLLLARKLLQDLCHRGLEWDTLVDESDRKAWQCWLENIKSIETIKVPRCISHKLASAHTVELHMFSDASEIGYGAVGYLRLGWTDSTNSCGFLFGKSRVTPKGMASIPRLELVAAVLSVKLMRMIQEELKLRIDRTLLWTDSTIVLQYIRNTSSRFATFVANRLRVIHESCSPSQWRHVPSILNPADIASRGTQSASSKQMDLWLRGPEFLCQSECQWPPVLIDVPLSGEDPEVKCLAATIIDDTKDVILDELVPRFGSWFGILKALAWLSRFVRYFIVLKVGRQSETVRLGSLKVSELEEACNKLVRLVQRRCFSDALNAVGKDNRNCTFKANSLSRLRPVIKDGLLCLGGRVPLAGGEKPYNAIILPAKDLVTNLVIKHYHEVEGHMGASHVLACIRKKFWILKGMASVRRVINQCCHCKRLASKPCEQIMAPLPSFRVEVGTYPFKYTGVDYFGPFKVRFGRASCKRYGCIFTCLQTRAIHLEVTHSLSTDSFLMALMRFVGRRGPPESFFSDNGSNFVGAEAELRKLVQGLDQERISSGLLYHKIDWHFNPPEASHRGGVWERMIRTVRRLLSSISREQVVGDETLLTYMVEVERIINNRPLIPVYDDPHEPRILRPNDLLLLRQNEGLVNDEISLSERYTRAWRQAQHLASVFWKRWIKEYLPTVQACHKWNTQRRDLRVGDLVMLIGGRRSVGTWSNGVVSEVIRGSDNHVRDVYVRTSTGLIKRDIRSLCLLEGALE